MCVMRKEEREREERIYESQVSVFFFLLIQEAVDHLPSNQVWWGVGHS